jgi:hypothetical protein
MNADTTAIEGYRYWQVRVVRGVRRDVARASRTELTLWAVLAAVLVGDTVLTVYGLRHGFVEGNPVLRIAIRQAGVGALLGAKVTAVGVGLLSRWLRPDDGVAIAAGLALPWLVAVAANLRLFLTV